MMVYAYWNIKEAKHTTHKIMVIENEEISRKKLELEETQSKKIETRNKKVESYIKQVHTQGLQLKNMGQKLNDLYGMLKVVQIAFPGLYNAASTCAVGTCDKQPSSAASPLMDHYSPVMDHYSPVMDHYPGAC
uniref:Ribose 5-phosphate isomerase, type A n=1 Tax=Tanacetum cinerariifolium TaxID=118510 RepID=A0A6L2L1S3_TANCI|nr:ribose 5-phosphate isomerase, type A [Tanacetum cinerariifolium]